MDTTGQKYPHPYHTLHAQMRCGSAAAAAAAATWQGRAGAMDVRATANNSFTHAHAHPPPSLSSKRTTPTNDHTRYPYPHPVQQVHKPTAPSSTTTPPIPICAGGLDWGPAGKAQGREVDAMAHAYPPGMAWHGSMGSMAHELLVCSAAAFLSRIDEP